MTRSSHAQANRRCHRAAGLWESVGGRFWVNFVIDLRPLWCRLQKVGWILSQSDTERDTILSAEETQQMAQVQACPPCLGCGFACAQALQRGSLVQPDARPEQPVTE